MIGIACLKIDLTKRYVPRELEERVRKLHKEASVFQHFNARITVNDHTN